MFIFPITSVFGCFHIPKRNAALIVHQRSYPILTVEWTITVCDIPKDILYFSGFACENCGYVILRE